MEQVTNIFDQRNCFKDNENIKSICIYDSKMSCTPAVSITIPTFNRPSLLKAALLSALTQDTDKPFEIIVVDNNTDNAYTKVIDDLVIGLGATNVKLYRNEENIGMFGNWNRCLELAKGGWVVILSDDDLLDSKFVSSTLTEISRNSDISLIGCITKINDERVVHGNVSLIRRVARRLKYLMYFPGQTGRAIKLNNENYFVNYPFSGVSGVIMCRKYAIELGGFDPVCYPSSDAIFITRFHLAHGSYLLPKELASYRIADNESFKIEVLYESVKQGLLMRSGLIQLLNKLPRIMNLYSKWRALETVKSYQLYFKNDMNISETYRWLDMTGKPHYLMVNILGIYIVYYFKMLRIISKYSQRLFS